MLRLADAQRARIEEHDRLRQIDVLHHHDCHYALCICRCGCQAPAGCILVAGPLCRMCVSSVDRGDSAHGEPVEAEEA